MSQIFYKGKQRKTNESNVEGRLGRVVTVIVTGYLKPKTFCPTVLSRNTFKICAVKPYLKLWGRVTSRVVTGYLRSKVTRMATLSSICSLIRCCMGDIYCTVAHFLYYYLKKKKFLALLQVVKELQQTRRCWISL